MERKKETKPNPISIISWNICKLATNKLYNLSENLTTYEGKQSKVVLERRATNGKKILSH
jgi:hypothetical protein